MPLFGFKYNILRVSPGFKAANIGNYGNLPNGGENTGLVSKTPEFLPMRNRLFRMLYIGYFGGLNYLIFNPFPHIP